MSVAKVIEITSTSPESFEHAIRTGLERTSRTVSGVQGAYVKEQQVRFAEGGITEFRVHLQVTFVLEG